MDKKTLLLWILRGLVSFLFIFSGYTKLVPLWAFEKQLVDLGLTDWCWAHYLARLIIALEFAIGIGIMQKHFLKRFVIPVTVLLLTAFIIHLCIVGAESGFTNGNCGCFGQVFPMTPIEAIIKNMVTIAIVAYIYFKLEKDDKVSNRFVVPVAIYALCALFMFVYYPFCPCLGENRETPVIPNSDVPYDDSDTLATDLAILPADTIGTLASADTATKVVVDPGPAAVVSKFAAFNIFGKKKVNLDQGKKIVCCFAPGCDHCQETAKLLAELAKKNQMPPMYILFMDEETEKIPEFLANSGIKAPYQVLDIVKFWTMMKNDGTPAVYYLWNGNIQYQCEGIDANAFNADAIMKSIKGN